MKAKRSVCEYDACSRKKTIACDFPYLSINYFYVNKIKIVGCQKCMHKKTWNYSTVYPKEY